MSPKEKAKELVDKMHDAIGFIIGKECALIAVDEIIKSWQEDEGLKFKFKVIWWTSVKEEINKL